MKSLPPYLTYPSPESGNRTGEPSQAGHNQLQLLHSLYVYADKANKADSESIGSPCYLSGSVKVIKQNTKYQRTNEDELLCMISVINWLVGIVLGFSQQKHNRVKLTRWISSSLLSREAT